MNWKRPGFFVILFVGFIVFLVWVLMALFATVTHAQTAAAMLEKMSISGFKGLDTRDDKYHLSPDYSPVFSDIHPSRHGLNTLSPRYEADSISALALSKYDSLLYLFPLERTWGDNRLVGVADSAGVGWANIFVTAKGSRDLSTRTVIWTGFTAQERPSMCQLDNKLLITSGQQSGVLWDGKVAVSFPMAQPGQASLVPIYKTSGTGELNGEYRYAFLLDAFYSDTIKYLRPGPYSEPVRVHNGRVRITGFQYVQADSNRGVPDSIWMIVGRTKVNPGIIDKTDSLFVSGIITLTASNYATAVYIDSTRDSGISSISNPVTIADSTRLGRDTLGNKTRRYGAPSYIGCSTDTTVWAGGLFRGGPVEHTVNDTGHSWSPALIYNYVWQDSTTGLISDTSRSLFVYSKTAGRKLWKVRTAYPTPPVGCKTLIFRSELHRVMTDSAEEVPWMTDDIYNKGYYVTGLLTIVKINQSQFSKHSDGKWYQKRTVALGDSMMVDVPLFLAVLKNDSTAYTDSIQYDSLRQRSSTYPFISQIPPRLNQAVVYGQRIVGHDGQRVWFSDITVPGEKTPGIFSFNIFNSRNMADYGPGLVTAIWPTRRSLVVKTDNASFNIFGANNEVEKTAGFGCVAPYSHVQVPGGDFYLSNNDVIFEAEGAQLERTFVPTEVSARLANFANMSITTKQAATGSYFDQQYHISVGDTDYVYDIPSKAWSTWTMPFGGGCLYDTGTTVGHVPSQTFLYFRNGGRTLYQYGRKNFTGTMIYETPAILFNTPWQHEPKRLGLLGKGTSVFGISASFFDMEDSSMGAAPSNGAITGFTPRYQYYELAPQNPSLSMRLRLSVARADSNFVINQVDIYHRQVDPVGVK